LTAAAGLAILVPVPARLDALPASTEDSHGQDDLYS
jgi:hypothetical protein